MKKFSKSVIAVICVALFCTAFAGCGGNQSDRVQTDGKSFTFWTPLDSVSSATMSSYSEMLFYQEMEKATGVKIDFIHPVQGSTGHEAFVVMVAGGELPDMIEFNWLAYTGGPQAAIDDGVIVALNDYIEEYAPNFYNYMEGEEGKKRGYSTYLTGTTDDGTYYGFNVLNLGATEGFAGLYCRSDLLEKWDMEVPQTIDDWTAYFAKAKEAGFDRALTGDNGLLSFRYPDNHSFNVAYDVGTAFYLEGDEVVFAPFQKGYKEYIAQMAEWYKAGYIDPGIITNDSVKIESNLVQGNSVAGAGSIGASLGTVDAALKNVNPEYGLVACPYPVLKKGDVTRFQGVMPDATTWAIGITRECGNYEAAVSWCDWIYSEEGIAAMLFGKEGDTYTVEEIDGEKHYVYTDKVLDYEASGFSSLRNAMFHYGLPSGHPGYNQHDDYLANYYQQQNQKDALKIWNPNPEEAVKHSLPTLTYTVEEQSEITDIIELIEAPLDVFLYDIIMGKKSIDEYEKGMESFAEQGYNRYLEINQTAYNRLLSKKEKIAG